jgi:superfamily II DNA or RNA helicase
MYTPYPHQIAAVDSVFSYYANGGKGNPVIAMPTATGKSLVIAELCKRILHQYPGQRLICLTHVKELITQNAEKIREQWPTVPLGIFSAGLRTRDTHYPILYGGIQSVVNRIAAFGHRDLMLVDEAHLISPKDGTNYQRVIKALRKINPHMKVIGFTATPYRTGQGLLTDGGLFTDICYDLTTFQEFNKLIAGGYLVAPVPKRTKTELDVSNVKITAGDFNKDQLQASVDIESVTYAACKESVEEGFDRKAWLAFASGIDHAEHIAEILQSLGIEAAAVHSKMQMEEADRRIAKFRAGKLRCVANYGMLTTGFDYPPIDFIMMLRPTASTVLWVQMVGRGTRPSPATLKENCLVLDFARNTLRLGPINDPVIPRKRVKGAIPGVAPVRICEVCGVYNHARATHCVSCGAEFAKVEKLIASAGTEALIRQDEQPIVGTFEVQSVIYNRLQRAGGRPMIKVSYFCGLQMFSEIVALEHDGYAAKKARDWWRERMGTPVAPPTTDEALKYVSRLRKPRRIRVHTNAKYPKVLNYEY